MEETGAQPTWLAALVASMADGVIGVRDGVVVSWNPAAEAMLGYLAADIVGAPVGRLDPALVADPAGWKALIGQVSADGVVRAARMPWHRPDGEVRVVVMTGMPIPPDANGRIGNAWIVREVDDSTESVIGLEHTDALTGLGNRRALEAALALRSGDDAPAMVLVVDVDDFVGVNHAVGHSGGDAVLIVIASRVRAAARPEDLVARIGTDQFAVYSRGADAATATAVAERIQAQVFAEDEVAGLSVGAQITKAIGAHGAWKKRLSAAIANGTHQEDIATVARGDRCEFGRWLVDTTPSGADQAANQASRTLHATFHTAAAAALRQISAGHLAQARESIDAGGRFAEASRLLTTTMIEWRKSTAGAQA